MRRAALIFNPAAGRRRQKSLVGPLTGILREQGFEAEPIPTTGPGDATRISSRIVAEGGWNAVFVLGGDGTVRETAAGMLGSSLPLGILPGGTTNVLARTLRLPATPQETARQARRLAPRQFDVGLCDDQPFLMMVSAGVDGAALGGVSDRLKARFGKVAVAASAVKAWWSYSYPEITLREPPADGPELTGTLVSISNIPLYGGGFEMAPGARFDDGRLDVVVFRGRGRRSTAGFALALARGRHTSRPDVETASVEEIVLDGPPDLALQVDGDVLAKAPPIHIRLSPEPLSVLAPRSEDPLIHPPGAPRP